MSETQTTVQALYNRRHREGVATRLKRLEALLEDLPDAIVAALRERQREQQQESHQ